MSTNTKTLLTVKIDKVLKERAKETAAEFGIPLGTMINSFLLNTVENRRFALTLRPNARLKKSILEADTDYKNGKLEEFDSVGDLIASLHS
jgi:addiction module RelB/DinJ family antitoxin